VDDPIFARPILRLQKRRERARELMQTGIPVSVGIASTKTLAKKNTGQGTVFVIFDDEAIERALESTVQ
jgi:hypothetical protein